MCPGATTYVFLEPLIVFLAQRKHGQGTSSRSCDEEGYTSGNTMRCIRTGDRTENASDVTCGFVRFVLLDSNSVKTGGDHHSLFQDRACFSTRIHR